MGKICKGLGWLFAIFLNLSLGTVIGYFCPLIIFLKTERLDDRAASASVFKMYKILIPSIVP